MRVCRACRLLLVAGVALALASAAACSPRVAHAPAAAAPKSAPAATDHAALQRIGERAIVTSGSPEQPGAAPAFVGVVLERGQDASESAATFWFYPGVVTDDGDEVRFAARTATRVVPQVARNGGLGLVRIVIVGDGNSYPSSVDPSVVLGFGRKTTESADWAALAKQQDDGDRGWEGVLRAATSYSADALPPGSQLPKSKE